MLCIFLIKLDIFTSRFAFVGESSQQLLTYSFQYSGSWSKYRVMTCRAVAELYNTKLIYVNENCFSHNEVNTQVHAWNLNKCYFVLCDCFPRASMKCRLNSEAIHKMSWDVGSQPRTFSDLNFRLRTEWNSSCNCLSAASPLNYAY